MVTTLAAAAEADGHSRNQAGVQAMVIAYLKQRYRQQRQQTIADTHAAAQRDEVTTALVDADAKLPGIV